MYKVGITGGIGSGKSTVCAMFEELGVAVYNSDVRAKELMTTNTALREAIVERFGAECYNADGLNRSYLAERVFSNGEELAALNGIVHPAVMADFEAWAESSAGSYVVLESAILFEAGLEGSVDMVIAVLAPQELRIERAMARDGAQREQIEARIRSQMSDDELADRAKYVVINIDIDDLREDVEQLHRRICYDSRA